MKITKYELISTLIFFISIFFAMKSCNTNKKELAQKNSMYKVANDSMVTYRNKWGQQVAKTEPLVTTNQKYFLEIQSKDSAIKRLQELVISETKVRKRVEVAMVLYTKTISDLKDTLENRIVNQTVYKSGDSVYVFPTYKKDLSDKWIQETIVIGPKTFNRKLVVNNEYNFVVGSEPAGLFKRKNYATVTSLSPYSRTVDLKVYQKKTEQKEFWPFVEGGIVGAGLMFLIKLL